MQDRQLPLAEDEIEIGNKIYKIIPVKLRHIKDGFYGYYMIIKQIGILKLLNFADGEDVLRRFLNGVFNDNKEIIDKVILEFDVYKMDELLEKVKKINDLDEDDVDIKKALRMVNLTEKNLPSEEE